MAFCDASQWSTMMRVSEHCMIHHADLDVLSTTCANAWKQPTQMTHDLTFRRAMITINNLKLQIAVLCYVSKNQPTSHCKTRGSRKSLHSQRLQTSPQPCLLCSSCAARVKGMARNKEVDLKCFPINSPASWTAADCWCRAGSEARAQNTI